MIVIFVVIVAVGTVGLWEAGSWLFGHLVWS
jgi:hypothetical protein